MSAPAETHAQALKRKYDQLQDKSSSFEELYHLMRTLPEAEALDIVRRIRADHADVGKVVRQVKQGCLLLQLALTPDTRFRYTFDYLQLPDMPVSLLSNDNPYLDTLCWDNPFPNVDKRTSDETREDCPYLRPYHAAQLHDERISRVKAAQWTSVVIDDQLFRDLLSSYFIYHYPTYYAFQKDLFLNDMVNNKSRFCTPLLVNAVLALSCACLPRSSSLNKSNQSWLTVVFRFVALRSFGEGPGKILGSAEPQLQVLCRGSTSVGDRNHRRYKAHRRNKAHHHPGYLAHRI